MLSKTPGMNIEKITQNKTLNEAICSHSFDKCYYTRKEILEIFHELDDSCIIQEINYLINTDTEWKITNDSFIPKELIADLTYIIVNSLS